RRPFRPAATAAANAILLRARQTPLARAHAVDRRLSPRRPARRPRRSRRAPDARALATPPRREDFGLRRAPRTRRPGRLPRRRLPRHPARARPQARREGSRDRRRQTLALPGPALARAQIPALRRAAQGPQAT